MRFAEVTTREAAEGLKGAYLEWVAGPDAELGRGEYFWHEVIGATVSGVDSALFAHAAAGMPAERPLSSATPPRAVASRAVPSRAVPSRAVRTRHPEPTASAAPDVDLDAPGTAPPVAPRVAAPSERAPSPAAPLTPAQSAGLGLDLPL